MRTVTSMGHCPLLFRRLQSHLLWVLALDCIFQSFSSIINRLKCYLEKQNQKPFFDLASPSSIQLIFLLFVAQPLNSGLHQGGRNGEWLFNGYRVIVLQYEELQRCMVVMVDIMDLFNPWPVFLKMVKMITFMLCIFCHDFLLMGRKLVYTTHHC